MSSLLERWMPRIWTRLFLLTCMAVVMTWGVIALSVRALQDADGVIREIDATHVPALTETSQLAAYVAELAIRSNELLLATDTSASRLTDVTATLNRLLSQRLDDPALERETREIVAQLGAVGRGLTQLGALEERIRDRVAQVRWLSLELEEESEALVADFTFNIQSQTRILVEETDRTARATRADFLEQETRLRDDFLGLLAVLTRSGSVAVQAANVTALAQLDQLDDILSDALTQADAILSDLPVGSEFLTIRQSVASLGDVVFAADGLIALRRDWITRRGDVQNRLDATLANLSDLQRRLQADAADQRRAFSTTITAFSTDAARKRAVLLITTVLALAGGLAILFAYIRPAILRPMSQLTAAMNAIAAGQSVDMGRFGAPRNDEIGQLANAVRSFQTSVQDRDRAISKLEAAQNELVQAGKMAALGNLSAGIGHELNQPLGAMKTRLHMLDAAITSEDQAAAVRQAGKIEDLVVRMELIIQHLKRFARRSEHLRDVVELSPVLRSATALMQTTFAERDITVTTDPRLKDLSFLGDPVLVEQVVVNLLSNASDAIAETGGPGEITIDLEEPPEGMIAFSVADTGAGPGTLDPASLVEPFVTSKDPGKGLGLGLSISYNILTGLGGDLAILRRAHNGLRVVITLPDAGGNDEQGS
ncbi:ATP-binding protein [Thalassorhabdomicrobium marinisediminis]|uniref:ATP-binding protein n=1 Tax=Thalassorhabdomicrobium marinisediminis TaxID=2170577 RepID=UPI0024902478|nr:ATP-binding protein [Thalassorhabdomicrobium marinisediminis]